MQAAGEQRRDVHVEARDDVGVRRLGLHERRAALRVAGPAKLGGRLRKCR